jgi:hypothetical protein
VAVQGIRADPENFESLVDRLIIGQAAEFQIFRRDELLRLTLAVAEPPKDTCYLTLDEQASPAALARRQSWLTPARS